MIAILGDIHFQSKNDYFIKTCEEFLKWFDSWSYNNKYNTLLLAGDLVEDYINGGIVINFLERFIQESKFKEIHICVGNHDRKKYQNLNQLAYEFYENKPNVIIHNEASENIIEGHKILFLPYFFGTNKYGKTMGEYYSNIYKDKEFQGPYDLVLGHFGGEDVFFKGSAECVENLDKIKTNRICLGHIHTRQTNPDRYIGSVYAGKKNENDNTRAAWIFDGVDWFEDPLPIFNEFITINYPDPIMRSKSLVPIYTILNCANEKLARDKYGNIFIRKTVSSNSDILIKEGVDADKFKSIKNLDIKNLFNEFIESRVPPLPRDVINECTAALSISLGTSV